MILSYLHNGVVTTYMVDIRTRQYLFIEDKVTASINEDIKESRYALQEELRYNVKSSIEPQL